MIQNDECTTHGDEGALALARFVSLLSTAATLAELDRIFISGFGRVMDAPMYGFNLVDPASDRLEHNTAANVSESFVARYIQVMDDDPLRIHALTSGGVAYNLALMSSEEWEESEVYRHAYRIHGMRHVVEAPILGENVVGSLHFARCNVQHDLTQREVRLVETLGGVLGSTIERIRAQEQRAHELEYAILALEIAGTSVVLSEHGRIAPRLNESARALIADVHDAEEHLYASLVRPTLRGTEGFSRRVEVSLKNGEAAMLHAYSRPAVHAEGTLVTVLELQRDHSGLAAGPLATLTPREADVAALIVQGLTDREIAESLCLSGHTVSQYVKRIYRKLGVDSRVTLTRLLLGAPVLARRS